MRQPVPSRPGAAAAGAAASARRERKQTATREAVLATSIIAFALTCALLGVFRIAGSMRETNARDALSASLTKVAALQDSYRRINARFATWPELSSRGARLPARQTVRRSTADASHWYMSLRDRQTGLVCDRIGELMDESGTVRRPSCRTPPSAVAMRGTQRGMRRQSSQPRSPDRGQAVSRNVRPTVAGERRAMPPLAASMF